MTSSVGFGWPARAWETVTPPADAAGANTAREHPFATFASHFQSMVGGSGKPSIGTKRKRDDGDSDDAAEGNAFKKARSSPPEILPRYRRSTTPRRKVTPKRFQGKVSDREKFRKDLICWNAAVLHHKQEEKDKAIPAWNRRLFGPACSPTTAPLSPAATQTVERFFPKQTTSPERKTKNSLYVEPRDAEQSKNGDLKVLRDAAKAAQGDDKRLPSCVAREIPPPSHEDGRSQELSEQRTSSTKTIDVSEIAANIMPEVQAERQAHYRWIQLDAQEQIRRDVKTRLKLDAKYVGWQEQDLKKEADWLEYEHAITFLDTWTSDRRNKKIRLPGEMSSPASMVVMAIILEARQNPILVDTPEDVKKRMMVMIQRKGIDFHRSHVKSYMHRASEARKLSQQISNDRAKLAIDAKILEAQREAPSTQDYEDRCSAGNDKYPLTCRQSVLDSRGGPDPEKSSKAVPAHSIDGQMPIDPRLLADSSGNVEDKSQASLLDDPPTQAEASPLYYHYHDRQYALCFPPLLVQGTKAAEEWIKDARARINKAQGRSESAARRKEEFRASKRNRVDAGKPISVSGKERFDQKVEECQAIIDHANAFMDAFHEQQIQFWEQRAGTPRESAR